MGIPANWDFQRQCSLCWEKQGAVAALVWEGVLVAERMGELKRTSPTGAARWVGAAEIGRSLVRALMR